MTRILAGTALLWVWVVSLPVQADNDTLDVPLIPRRVLFADPDRVAVRLSPDGRQLTFVMPYDGVPNVWLAPADDPAAAQPITQDQKRGVVDYDWAYTNRHVLYRQDRAGNNNWRVYCLDLATRAITDLTPLDNIQAQVEATHPDRPEEVVLGINNRDLRYRDPHRVNILTGEKELLRTNPGFVEFFFDHKFRPRLGLRVIPEGGAELLEPGPGDSWLPLVRIPQEDVPTTRVVGLDARGYHAYLLDSRERDTAALLALDLFTGDKRTLAEDARREIVDVLIHPAHQTVEAVAVHHLRQEWKILEAQREEDFAYLRTVCRGDITVVSRSQDDERWLVADRRDDGPIHYYRYDRTPRRATLVFTNLAALEGLPLARMHAFTILARDGLPLVSYLTLPIACDPDQDGRPQQPVPLVVNVHSGPWTRDTWGYSSYHQWLANRGYATLSVNYRGSTGFGKAFLNAGDRETGGMMQTDLVDAVRWAIAQRIAEPQKIALLGHSYGGYAVLWCLLQNPELFACGVDVCGPVSLLTLLQSVPPTFGPIIKLMYTRLGDPRDEAGRAFLAERSPLSHADRFTRPLLIAQGGRDPRVKTDEVEQIVAAMRQRDVPVTFVLYPDEAHGLGQSQNRHAFLALAEAFLAQHLGGRAEPFGEDLAGSSFQVRAGAARIPGLNEALAEP